MGFYEDDRIVSKNRIHNEAYNFLTKLRLTGLKDSEIEANIDSLMLTHQSEIRNDLRNIILKIIGSSNASISN